MNRKSGGVIWLADSRCQDAQLVGNKAANLAKLLAFGYRVPPGFCVPPGLDGNDPAIREALGQLPGPWAIRSSSTAEDSQGLAFPGIFTTVLGLNDNGEAIKAIEMVRASAQTARVRSYAQQYGIKVDDIRMAVVIQHLVPATAAGVAFSRNPVNGAPNISIEATWGLGETLVDGSITPDYFEVSPAGLIINSHVGSKKTKAIYYEGKVSHVATAEKERSNSALPAKAVLELAQLIRNVERSFGNPQDVEWATDGEKFYLTQARPITTLDNTKDS